MQGGGGSTSTSISGPEWDPTCTGGEGLPAPPDLTCPLGGGSGKTWTSGGTASLPPPGRSHTHPSCTHTYTHTLTQIVIALNPRNTKGAGLKTNFPWTYWKRLSCVYFVFHRMKSWVVCSSSWGGSSWKEKSGSFFPESLEDTCRLQWILGGVIPLNCARYPLFNSPSPQRVCLRSGSNLVTTVLWESTFQLIKLVVETYKFKSWIPWIFLAAEILPVERSKIFGWVSFIFCCEQDPVQYVQFIRCSWVYETGLFWMKNERMHKPVCKRCFSRNCDCKRTEHLWLLTL